MQKQKLLFVCHGNICRSTMAEFVMKEWVQQHPSGETFEIVSAATSREEIGNDTHWGTKEVDFLQQYANAKGLIVDTIVRDYGSGLNYNRKKWNQLLDAVMENQVRMILVSHRDRFVRFGFDWFERFCKKFNVEIVVVKNEKLSPQEELVQDIVSILHVFSCRLYGLRKYKKQIEGDEELAEGIQDRAPSHRTAEG
ncbi:IS607 family transposase [Mitsuokella multacida]|uniref:IS607 family transposase n=1 Tax=Mitsuokella multacida TaxID=52226 RepID=UPI003F5F9579